MTQHKPGTFAALQLSGRRRYVMITTDRNYAYQFYGRIYGECVLTWDLARYIKFCNLQEQNARQPSKTWHIL